MLIDNYLNYFPLPCQNVDGKPLRDRRIYLGSVWDVTVYEHNVELMAAPNFPGDQESDEAVKNKNDLLPKAEPSAEWLF